MSYWTFDLLAVAVPAALLLRGRRLPLGRVALLAAVALLWTAPWDEHLVRTGVWSYGPDRVLATVGSVPAEEYAFVVLLVVLVAAWGRRTGLLDAGPAAAVAAATSGAAATGPGASAPLALPAGPGASAPVARPGASGPPARPAAPTAAAAPSRPGVHDAPRSSASPRRSSGALPWCAVAALGLVLLAVGGRARYLGLLLAWAAPPLALQAAVAGDLLRAQRLRRLLLAGPVALWLCTADRLALADGVWTISPVSSTGVLLLGLPLEEALFFALTCLLVADGLLLAGDARAVARARSLLPARLLPARPVPAHALPARVPGGRSRAGRPAAADWRRTVLAWTTLP